MKTPTHILDANTYIEDPEIRRLLPPFKSSLGELKRPFNFMYDGKKMELRTSKEVPKGTIFFGNRPDLIILDDLEDKDFFCHTAKMTKEELEKLYPPNKEGRMYHDVTIQKVSNGFIVKVGCMTIVSTSWKEVTNGLEEYWKNPKKAEEKFRKKNGLSVPYTSGVLNQLKNAEEGHVLPPRRSQLG